MPVPPRTLAGPGLARPLAWARACACAGAWMGAAACDERPKTVPAIEPAPALPAGPVAPETPAASVLRVLGIDAGDLDPHLDPAAPGGDLAADIERFTTLDRCVAERAPVDPLVGDALESIGYATFLRDACRVVQAAKTSDPALCDAIDATSLRDKCLATQAEVAARPDACPWQDPTHPARGRDPACVAIAARDLSLCAAAAWAADRATCEATLLRDPARCRSLGPDAARCARDARRWRGVLAASRSTALRAPEARSDAPEGKLSIQERHGGAPLEVDLAPDLARGVTVVTAYDGVHFVLGPGDTEADFVAPSPHVRPSLTLDLVAPASIAPGATAGGRAVIERFALRVPGQLEVATPHARSTLVATLATLDATRGGKVAFAVDGEAGVAGKTYRVHARGTTFVRDVVSTGHAIPRVRLDGGAR